MFRNIIIASLKLCGFLTASQHVDFALLISAFRHQLLNTAFMGNFYSCDFLLRSFDLSFSFLDLLSESTAGCFMRQSLQTDWIWLIVSLSAIFQRFCNAGVAPVPVRALVKLENVNFSLKAHAKRLESCTPSAQSSKPQRLQGPWQKPWNSQQMFLNLLPSPSVSTKDCCWTASPAQLLKPFHQGAIICFLQVLSQISYFAGSLFICKWCCSLSRPAKCR